MSSSGVLCSFALLVDIVVLVRVFYLVPSSVRVVGTLSSTVLFPLLCSVLPFFSPLIHWFFSLFSFVMPSKCLIHFICAASKRCSSLQYPGFMILYVRAHTAHLQPCNEMYLFCLQVSESVTNITVKKSRASHEVKSPTDIYDLSVVWFLMWHYCSLQTNILFAYPW